MKFFFFVVFRRDLNFASRIPTESMDNTHDLRSYVTYETSKHYYVGTAIRLNCRPSLNLISIKSLVTLKTKVDFKVRTDTRLRNQYRTELLSEINNRRKEKLERFRNCSGNLRKAFGTSRGQPGNVGFGTRKKKKTNSAYCVGRKPESKYPTHVDQSTGARNPKKVKGERCA